MIQQLKLNGSDVAEVERLEEEEDELALPVLEVEGGGGAVAQARNLQEKVKQKLCGEMKSRRG